MRTMLSEDHGVLVSSEGLLRIWMRRCSFATDVKVATCKSDLEPQREVLRACAADGLGIAATVKRLLEECKVKAGLSLVRNFLNEWADEGGVRYVASMEDLSPHIAWLRTQLSQGAGWRALRKRVLAVKSVCVGEGLMRRWRKSELSSQEASHGVGPQSRPEPVRQLHDLDDLDVYGQELWVPRAQ